MISILKGDCLEIAPMVLGPGSVDLILTDLPYKTTRGSGAEWNNVVIDLDAFWGMCAKVLKPKGCIVMTATQPFTTELIATNYDWFRYDLVWRKPYTTSFGNTTTPLRQHETVLVFSPVNTANFTYNPQMLQKVIPGNGNTPRREVAKRGPNLGKFASGKLVAGGVEDRPLRVVKTVIPDLRHPTSVLEFGKDADRTGHPSQKPLEMWEFLVRSYSNEGDMVLDTCLGSGTTAVACHNTGRDCIGIEIYDPCYQMAMERCKALEIPVK